MSEPAPASESIGAILFDLYEELDPVEKALMIEIFNEKTEGL